MKEKEEAQSFEETTYWVFKIGEKDFLLSVEQIREVIEVSDFFSIPLAPEYVCGVISLHGRVIPAIDLSKIYPTGKPLYHGIKLIVVDVEVKLMRETINESIGFLSEILPYPTEFSSDISPEDLIDVNRFFQDFSVKDMQL
ncbi:MAG: hypothetical protein CVV37_02165 [Nitrospira bacterium HGW-Nitrospira-1]|nr:MAG: hypothetical protein CVV37_02165 [Nitrospira bacterium HGW-Nitrospira-1]